VLTTGLAFLAQTVPLAALSLGPTTWILHRTGPRVPVLAGIASATAGLVLLAHIGPGTAYVPQLMLAFALVGAGAGLGFMPLLTMAMAHVEPADTGLASGIVNTSLQVSAAIGTAVFASVSAAHTGALRAAGRPELAALVGGYRLAFSIAAGCVAAGGVVMLVGFAIPRVRRVLSPRPSVRAS
jgi:MFS family permease